MATTIDDLEFGIAPLPGRWIGEQYFLTTYGVMQKLGIRSRTTLLARDEVAALRRTVNGRNYWLASDVDAYLQSIPKRGTTKAERKAALLAVDAPIRRGQRIVTENTRRSLSKNADGKRQLYAEVRAAKPTITLEEAMREEGGP